MDSETRQEMDEIKASQLRTNQSLEQLTEITAGLATTVNEFVTEQRATNQEQREANKEMRAATQSLKAGQEQLNAIVNKILDDQ